LSVAITRADLWSGTTARARRFKSPLREFLRTESGGAVVLLAATMAALVWVNVDASAYEGLWETVLAIDLGRGGLELTLREWVNSGLMTFFFFVLGLEARREFDLGDFRERRRLVLPLLASAGGMGAAVAIYLAFNLGSSGAQGWGIAMSTDTAFALGLLTLLGRGAPDRLRAFMLTVVIADDVLALVVIALVYSHAVDATALIWMAGLFVAALVLLLGLELRRGPPYFLVGGAMWVAALQSGIDPLVVGLAFGLLVWATPAARADLEHAGKRFREFREQPTPELQRMARESIRTAMSPNERLQLIYHPWTSYVIVPLFALANAGVAIDGDFLERAARSPITLGVLVGYVAGKPLSIAGTALLVSWLSRGRLRPTAGWGAVAGAGASAGVGFTVSLLVATLAFHGAQLDEAKAGILAAPIGAAAVTWLVFRTIGRLSPRRRTAALLGGAEPLLDLEPPVDPGSDHIRGPLDAPVTVVEYGDFECPYCGRAEPVVRELLRDFADVRYVWRHLPLADVHFHAELAALASEAAAGQGAFWPMHDQLLEHQDKLQMADLVSYADRLGLDVARFTEDLQRRVGANRIAQDVEGADLSGVSGTPTFFINGRRHHGAYDIDHLSRAVRAAGARATLAAS
jgi:Na+/H+ antiporter NhaA